MSFLRSGIGTSLLGLVFLGGCATAPPTSSELLRDRVETQIETWGLSEDPAIQAQRAVVEAAAAREDDSPILDEIEIRAAAVHESDEKVQMLARVPFAHLFATGPQREARRASTEAEIGRLAELTLEQRVRYCVPSIERLTFEERSRIHEQHASRQQRLLQWNRELRKGGVIKEVDAERFDLRERIRLSQREPQAPLEDPAFAKTDVPYAVLPEPGKTPELVGTPEVVRERVVGNHPSVGVFRSQGREFEALARRERAKRYPSLRFVDVGFEPVAFSGDDRQIEARASFEVPFGRAARAGERRYQALARGQKSAQRATIDRNVSVARMAIEEINRFSRRGPEWLGLLERASAAETRANRWWKRRVANPKEISQLFEEVYDARMTVLDARREAGLAGCRLLETSGVRVEAWPR